MKFLVFLLLFPMPSFATIKVAIIDSGIKRTELTAPLCPESKDFLGKRDSEDQTHGTIVAKALTEGLEGLDYCIMDLRVFDDNKGNNYDVSNAIIYATEKGASIINLSLSGDDSSFYEKSAIEKATKQGVLFFVAAGNNKQNLDAKCNSYPSCYRLPKVYVIGDNCTNVSNTGSVVNLITCSRIEYEGSYHYGTSFSSPKIINLLLKTYKDLKK
jgi:subtilisin family serine protease